MNLQQYILHPELLDRGTLYELRALTARYPYYQPARLLLLKNLYLLHDSTFDEELRRAAIYVADRRKLFELVEAAHYQLRQDQEKTSEKNVLSEGTTIGKQEEETAKADKQPATDRTTKLIDDFLEQIPHDEEKKDAEKDTTESGGKTPKPKKRRKPTVADATGDYMAYLMEVESEDEQEEETKDQPQLKGHNLIDDFLNNDDGKIELNEDPEYEPEIEDDNSDDDDDSGFFTETLARIYIKQGRYSKALEIIRRLNLIYPKKSRYFADQIRFLEKLIINENNTKEQ
ncbi:hypothetical protein PRLR6025_11300 [Prevotella lacticifex]|uniref:tetratricopeptide repeat protein n=1 Tax=Prevotella lacticifex TaxID=2854755 RepID=UPI001CC781F4|nr:tetratricopeptide repeat protein [Prevotella lacticifex]GJG67661.1 hypothetical protein PRLR6025_11300 [Prevotella lacticifex]